MADDCGPESDPQTRTTKLTPSIIAAFVGACAAVAPLTQHYEGLRNKSYRDIASNPTICWGHTGKDVRMGEYWSDGTCRLVFTKDQERLGIGAARCTPATVIRNRYMMGSVVDFVFNGGSGLYCGDKHWRPSPMMRNFWTGNYRAACNGFYLYIYAHQGKRKFVVKGLKTRRAGERAMCLQGLG